MEAHRIMFESQSRARVINTRMTLATTQKGSLTVAEYISKMKILVDDRASTRKKLDDEDFISYILVRLDAEYNLIVSSIARRVELIGFAELYSQLLAYENRLDLQLGGQGLSQSSANSAVAVACHVEEAILVAEAEVAPSRRRTSSHCVNFVEEPTTWYSSAISDLIQLTWEKRRVPIPHTRMELARTGMQTLVQPLM
jgi:hypothetical protein